MVKMNKRKRDDSEPVSPNSKRVIITMDSGRSTLNNIALAMNTTLITLEDHRTKLEDFLTELEASIARREESVHPLLFIDEGISDCSRLEFLNANSGQGSSFPLESEFQRWSVHAKRAFLEDVAHYYGKVNAILQQHMMLQALYCERLLANQDAMEERLRTTDLEMQELREESNRFREKLEQELPIGNLRTRLDTVRELFDGRMELKAALRELITIKYNHSQSLQQLHLLYMNRCAFQLNRIVIHLSDHYLPV
ncbi:hypothetical protein F5Y08DRAFT_352099 [Xylaria arbuscula]|nr:hypothetical protein F5Y08DRAFT_352099 [Xylaria arbuscula]